MNFENGSPEERVEKIVKASGNETCVDCPAKQPQWASFLRDRSKDEKINLEGALGVLLCDKCAQHHHFELGKKRCLIKSLKHLKEWNDIDFDILDCSGNTVVNQLYEDQLTKKDFDKDTVAADADEEDKRRGKFVKCKYKRCNFRKEDADFELAVEKLHLKTEHRQIVRLTSKDVSVASRRESSAVKEEQGKEESLPQSSPPADTKKKLDALAKRVDDLEAMAAPETMGSPSCHAKEMQETCKALEEVAPDLTEAPEGQGEEDVADTCKTVAELP